MHEGKLIFSQLMDFIPKRDFDECVKRYRGNYRAKEFSCRDQFLAMTFAQLTYRESLRDIETCLNAVQPKLYHAGFRGRVSKSTLSDANRRRDWFWKLLVVPLSQHERQVRDDSGWQTIRKVPQHVIEYGRYSTQHDPTGGFHEKAD